MKKAATITIIIAIIAVIAIVFATSGMKNNPSTNVTNTNQTNTNLNGTNANITTNTTATANNTNTTGNNTNVTNTGANATMKLETFGGFLAPAYYRHVTIISKTGIDYTVYAQNDSVTEHKTFPVTMQAYDSLLQTFKDGNFTSLNSTYRPQHPNPDVGSTNISLTMNNVTKSVLIKQGFDGAPYPDSLTNIIESLQNLVPQ